MKQQKCKSRLWMLAQVWWACCTLLAAPPSLPVFTRFCKETAYGLSGCLVRPAAQAVWLKPRYLHQLIPLMASFSWLFPLSPPVRNWVVWFCAEGFPTLRSPARPRHSREEVWVWHFAFLPHRSRAFKALHSHQISPRPCKIRTSNTGILQIGNYTQGKWVLPGSYSERDRIRTLLTSNSFQTPPCVAERVCLELSSPSQSPVKINSVCFSSSGNVCEDGAFPFRGAGIGDGENKFSNQEGTESLP